MERMDDAMTDDWYAVIPAGGTGSRLWPISRRNKPKFLYDILGQGRTLLQSTYDRLARRMDPDHICVVTGWRHVDEVRRQLPQLPTRNILAEPVQRDSTAAIALAAAVMAKRHGKHIVIGSFAADHVIRGMDAFDEAVEQAVVAARAGYLATIGIAASRPSTAFGYIHEGNSLADELPAASRARKVLRFVEKPDAVTAQSYLSTGEYRWNAGMFMMRVDMLFDFLRSHKPQIATAIEEIADVIVQADDGSQDAAARIDEVMARHWHGIEKIAFDYAVAEPLSLNGGVAVVPGDFGWDDVGDFNSVAALLPSANERNVKIVGNEDDVVLLDSAGDVVVPASGRTVALLGVNDMVVADTPDALLVAPRARSQEVKDMVKVLAQQGRREVL